MFESREIISHGSSPSTSVPQNHEKENSGTRLIIAFGASLPNSLYHFEALSGSGHGISSSSKRTGAVRGLKAKETEYVRICVYS